MAKELPYFRFNSSEWLTGNICYESYELQGVFIRLCAEYWNRKNDLSLQDARKRINADALLQRLVQLDYIKVADGMVKISFLDEEREYATRRNNVLSEAGRKGGLSKAKAKLKPGQSEALAYKNKIENKKKKKKEIKNVTPSADDSPSNQFKFLEIFNECKKRIRGRLDKPHKTLTLTDLSNLNKILKDGYTWDEVKHAVEAMLYADWPRENKNDTPAHVLRNENFLRYLHTEHTPITVEKPSHTITRDVWFIAKQVPAEMARLCKQHNMTEETFTALYDR